MSMTRCRTIVTTIEASSLSIEQTRRGEGRSARRLGVSSKFSSRPPGIGAVSSILTAYVTPSGEPSSRKYRWYLPTSRKYLADEGSSQRRMTLAVGLDLLTFWGLSTARPASTGGTGSGRLRRWRRASTGRGDEPMRSRISLIISNLVRASLPPVAGDTGKLCVRMMSLMASRCVFTVTPSICSVSMVRGDPAGGAEVEVDCAASATLAAAELRSSANLVALEGGCEGGAASRSSAKSLVAVPDWPEESISMGADLALISLSLSPSSDDSPSELS